MSESRRKRKSAPPRRLDASAREEHNWEVNKSDLDSVELQAVVPENQPNQNEKAYIEQQQTEVGETTTTNDDNNQTEQEDEVRPRGVFDLLRELENLEGTFVPETPTRAPKKQRKEIPAPTYVIHFNNQENNDTDKGLTNFVDILAITVKCERHNEGYYDTINANSHLYTRFVSPHSSWCDFVTTSGDVMAAGDLTFPQQVISSLFSLQKRGLVCLDALPVKSSPVNQISIRVLLTSAAFIACTATNSNTRKLNNHIKSIINYVYNINGGEKLESDKNSNSNSNSNDITNNNDNNSNNTEDGIILGDNMSTSNTAATAEDVHHFDPLQLYSAVKPTNSEPQLDPSIISHALLPTLRPYQLRAAYWMLQREICKKESVKSTPSDILHPLWTECVSREGKKFYYNAITGTLTFQRFTVEDEGEFCHSIPGGILADEPGLGKTLEVMALVLSHPSDLPSLPTDGMDGKRKEKGVGKEEEGEKGKEKGKQKVKREEEKTEKGKGKGKGEGKGKAKESNKGIKRRRKHYDSDDEYTVGGTKKVATEDVVNCPCGKAEMEHPPGLWLSCDVCAQWSFAACAGYKGRTNIPTEYSCFKCESDTPPPSSQGEGVSSSQEEEELIETKGTLIVCPLAIREQWKQEIETHSVTGALSVRVYNGVRYGDDITPRGLAQYDIVLTTYDVLRTELDHLDTTGREGTLRNKKRYLIAPTPLASLIWWRVCLDEAQMVESTSTKAAMMALHLHTHHRWCVTGTPVQRGLEDLYGLLLFLQASPFDHRFWWHNAIQSPYEQGVTSAMDRLHKFLKPIMWRNNKEDIVHELQLPEQIEKEVKLLRFSAVESTFYRKQHEECSANARAVLRTFSNRGSPITTRLRSAKILRPLLRLRQACCHPQVGSRGIRALQKNSLTMDELLDHLSMTAKVDCQEAQRAVLSSMNGLAALDVISGDNNAAADKYRAALALFESNENVIEADKLQQLHIFHNLAEMVAMGNLAANSLRDDTFKAKATSIRQQLVTDREYAVGDALRQMQDISSKVVLDPSFYKPATQGRSQTWWLEASAFIERRRLFDEFLNRIAQLEHLNKTATLWKEIHDSSGLSYSLTMAFDELFKLRNSILEKANELDVPITNADVMAATSCNLCARGDRKTKGIVCKYCVCLGMIDKYKKRLFSAKKNPDEADADEVNEGEDEVHDDTNEPEGHWWKKKSTVAFGDSEYEHILQVLIGIVRLQDRGNPLIQAAQLHFDALTQMKEECKKVGTFIVAKRDLVNVLDEVDMATTRMRLRFPGETVLPGEELFKLHPAEVEPNRARLAAELVVHETELKKMKGQMHYLKSLAEARKRHAHRRQQRETAAGLGESAVSRNSTGVDSSGANSSAADSSAVDSSAVDSSAMNSSGANSSSSSGSNSSETDSSSSSSCVRREATPSDVSSSSASSTDANVQPKLPITTPLTASTALPAEDEEGSCPVCREDFTSDVVILMCGHTFCYECMMHMIGRIHFGNTFKCPTCRTRVNIDEISYVSESGNQAEHLNINVKGSWGTKIEAVVRELLALQLLEPGAKALVFSQWNEVLEIASRALAENGVKFARVHGKRSIEKAIHSFKKDPTTSALLLPVASGANGLNLVEATHVFLIDPLLNPAAEAQAINRVHRIGQTKETLIHRFIVGGTIEEKVWSLGKHKAEHQHSDFWRMQSKKEHDLLTLQDFCELFADANGNV